MTAEVHTIHGGKATLPGEPDADVVECIEMLLDRAKRGDLVGIAYAAVHNNGEQATGWVGGAGTRHSIGTSIMILFQRYTVALRDK